jgi:Zn-dependent M28 family amino/carboxypeptidase
MEKSILVIIMISMAFPTEKTDKLPSFSVSKDKLKVHVERIIDTPSPRCYGDTASLNMVADYIKSQFKSLGYSPVVQAFEVGGQTYKNIIALIGPSNTRRKVIGAHYDVAGYQDGADDNASGVSGLLELARIVKENEHKLKKQIEFVAYSLEEPPNFGTKGMGSYIHAKSRFDNNIDVEVMIGLEMIGYFTDEPKSQKYPLGLMRLFYPSTGNFIAAVGTYGSGKYVKLIKEIINEKTDIRCCSLTAPKFIPGVDFSDHRNYWLFGFKALMITDTSFYRNKAYHTEDDTIDTLDFSKMAEVVKGLAFFIFM